MSWTRGFLTLSKTDIWTHSAETRVNYIQQYSVIFLNLCEKRPLLSQFTKSLSCEMFHVYSIQMQALYCISSCWPRQEHKESRAMSMKSRYMFSTCTHIFIKFYLITWLLYDCIKLNTAEWYFFLFEKHITRAGTD